MFSEKINIKVGINSTDNVISKTVINQDLKLQFIKNILERIQKEIKKNE